MTEMMRIENLVKYFNTPAGTVHAVDDVSFSIEKGKTVGVVGESGCGKTTLGRTVLRLTPATSGKVFLDGKDVLALSGSELKKMRKVIPSPSPATPGERLYLTRAPWNWR